MVRKTFIVDLSFVKPVFLNIPGYGTMFVRDLDQDDKARIAKAVYMEMALILDHNNITVQSTT